MNYICIRDEFHCEFKVGDIVDIIIVDPYITISKYDVVSKKVRVYTFVTGGIMDYFCDLVSYNRDKKINIII